MIETTEFRTEPVADLIGQGIGGRRFAGLHLTALGEDGETLVAAGHVEPARMIRACRAYQKWADGAGWWGTVLRCVVRRPWRLVRAVRYANQSRQWRRSQGKYDWPGADAVEHVLAAAVPGCSYQRGPYDAPEENDHRPGCNCDGPWICWGSRTPDATEPLTVVEWF